MLLKPPTHIEPWQLWRMLVTLPRPSVPVTCRLAGAGDVSLVVRALSSAETEWARSAASGAVVSSWARRLLTHALRQDDGSAVFRHEQEVGCLSESDLGGLVNVAAEALAVIGPTMITSDLAAWKSTLKEGAAHPANFLDAYALGGCWDVSWGLGKGAVHITEHPEWWFGVPQRELIDCHWLAYRAAVSMRVEADKRAG